MKESILVLAAMFLFFSCGNSNSKRKDVVTKVQVKKAMVQKPILHVYNMGGVPEERMKNLLVNLKRVYKDVVYDGKIPFNDKTHINTTMGNDRYGATWIMDDMKKKFKIKDEIQLVIVNAEVCDWKPIKNSKEKRPHALFGCSYLGGRQSVIGLSRFSKTKRLTDENLFKIVMHELGHALGGLVPNRKSDGAHCPNKNCLMINAKDRYPYTQISSFCPSCDKVMKNHGFDTSRMEF